MTALFSSTVNRTPQQTRGLVARSAAVSGVFQAVLTNQALKKNK